MDELYIYTTTDANELRTLLSNQERVDFIDLLIVDGHEIQKNLKLSFNPMSYCLINSNHKDKLIKNLLKHGLFVAESENGSCAKQYFPSKYDGYQGGGMF